MFKQMYPERIDFAESRNSGQTLLHIAARNGNAENVKLLIQAGYDANARDDSGQTPMMLALKGGPYLLRGVIEVLCQANANICLIDESGKSAAELVLDNSGDVEDCIIKLFLEIIHREFRYESKKTAEKLIDLRCPLWKAMVLQKAEVIEQMILRGCPVNSRHPRMELPVLSRAVQLMDLEMVKVLIKYGANVNSIDNRELLPIAHYGSHIPGRLQQPEIIKMLLSGTVLLKFLYEYPNYVAYQLRKTFECGNREVIRMLLEFHDDILNITDLNGQTPLHYLSTNCHLDVTEELRGRKLNVNVRDARGRTPLFTATQSPRCHISTFKFMLKNGADVNARTHDQEVPLFSLCYNSSLTKGTYFGVVEIFLQYNLDIQFIGPDHKTVFDYITKNNTLYMAEPLLVHLAILEEQGNSVTEYILYKINSNRIFKNCFDVCRAELTKMKNDVINKNLTLYAILVDQMSEEQILKRCRYNPHSLTKLKKLKNQFNLDHYYYAVVQGHISSIVSQLELIQKAAPIICKLLRLGIDANHLVVIEIINNLNRQDLLRLTKVKM